MKILHCADLHIDSPLTGLSKYEGFPAEELRGATRQAVQNLVDYACDPKNQIDVVTVGGDVFDGTWESADTGLWWNLQLGRLAESGCEVFVVHGNHDADSRITDRISPPPGVHVFGSDAPASIEATNCDLVVHGQSYAHAATLTDLGSAYPTAKPGVVNMGLLHTSLDGRPGHEPYSPCNPSNLALKGYELWGLGHIHMRDDQIQFAGSRFIFPGNTQGRSVRETGPKGASVITFAEDRSISSVEFVPFDVVRWTVARIDIGELEDRSAIRSAVQQHVLEVASDGHTVAVRVELVGSGPLHSELAESTDKLENQLRGDLGALSGATVGLERVKNNTTAQRRNSDTTAAEQQLIDFVQRAKDDPELLKQLAAQLKPAAQKLLAYDRRLREAEWPVDIDTDQVVRAHLDDSLELLLARIGNK